MYAMIKQKKLCKNFNKHLVVPFLMLIFFALLVLGCGKKAPPVPPREAKPLTGNNVCASVDRPTHKITWTFHREKGMTMPHLSCFIVYRVKMLHSDSNFKNPPALFTCIADILIKISAYEYKKATITCLKSLEKAYRYI
jgi:hypothetical protein